MNETYKFLKKTITKNFNDTSDEDICELYQHGGDNELISSIFCRHFMLWKSLLKKYGFFVDSDEYPSIILENLDKAMKSFARDKNTTFKTLATTIIRNNLINLNRYYGLKKEVERTSVSYDVQVDENDDNSFLDGIEDCKYGIDINAICTELDVKHSLNLNNKEINVCSTILNGEAENKLEIAHAINKSRFTVYEYIRNIKDKLDEEYFRGL